MNRVTRSLLITSNAERIRSPRHQETGTAIPAGISKLFGREILTKGRVDTYLVFVVPDEWTPDEQNVLPATGRHMLEEGFDERNIIEVLTGHGRRIPEDYPEQRRCLVIGSCVIERQTRVPLHLVYDYSDQEVLDVVTAYIPQAPWWVTPSKRGQRR